MTGQPPCRHERAVMAGTLASCLDCGYLTEPEDCAQDPRQGSLLAATPTPSDGTGR